MLRIPARLLAASAGLSTAAIVTTLLLPKTSRVVRLPEVARRDVNRIQADLYFDPGRPSPGVVLVLGALREGRRYAMLESVARLICACGYSVLVPELGRLRRLVLAEDALEDLVGATLALIDLPEVLRAPVGLFGFSLGGSLALLAAGDHRLRRSLACVACVGGYFSLVDMLTTATTGVVRGSRQTTTLAGPSVYAVAASLIALLPSEDRRLLERALQEQPDFPLEAMSRMSGGSMGPQGKTVLALLANRDPGAVASLLQGLDGAMAALARLSPASVIDSLEAPVWVLHDERDRYVPSQQSRLMAEAVAARSNFKFFSVRLLEHTEPAPPTLDVARLFRDYLPGLVQFTRFVHGPLAALNKASR